MGEIQTINSNGHVIADNAWSNLTVNNAWSNATITNTVHVGYDQTVKLDRDYFFKAHKIPGDFVYLDAEGTLKQVSIKETLFSNPATVVFWNDGTRTTCKATEVDVYTPESGISMCINKKLYGSSYMKKVFKTWVPETDFEKGKPVKVTLKEARKNFKK